MTNETEVGTPIADSLREHGSKYYNHERYDEKLIKAIEKLERDLNAANAKAERFRVALANIRDVYAGKEDFESETAPEDYLQGIVKQMRNIARESLEEK